MAAKEVEDQLERAKEVAIAFLHLPMKKVESIHLAILVQHPFFEYPFLSDENGIFNALEEKERYRRYLGYFAENGIGRCGSLEALLFLVRKSYRLTFLSFLSREKILSKKECGNLLARQWTLIENLSHDANVKKETVLGWILAADKAALMSVEERRVYAALPEIVTIYRGCRTAAAVKGMSWTLSEEKARWFAARFSGEDGGLVYQAKVKKGDVIAYLSERDEEEIVVDWKKLFDVSRCDI